MHAGAHAERQQVGLASFYRCFKAVRHESLVNMAVDKGSILLHRPARAPHLGAHQA